MDVVVVGAGPGGLAAAGTAAAAGLRVAVLDRYDAAGGQIGRQPAGRPGPVGPWAELIAEGTGRADHLTGTSVIALRRLAADASARFEAIVSRDGRIGTVLADHVVLATGAREVVAPFPGWTLPGVVTAGALQALVKREGTSPWRRVGLAGSGPLLLAVADAVRRSGTSPTFLLESRTIRQLATGGLPLAVRQPGKAALFAKLAGPHPPRFGWRVVEAVATAGAADTDTSERLCAAVIADSRGRERTVALDALAVSGGLVPDVTLAVQLGCATRTVPGGAGPAVVVDDDQRTAVEGVLAVGEVTGVGGADKAVAEGRLAGAVLAGTAPTAADGTPGTLDDLRAAAARWRRFADALARLYPWEDAWAPQLPDDELVCRCEEVPIGAVRRAVADGATTARAVKGLTRCGMGLCQGAVCGPLVSSALRAAGHDDPDGLEHRPLAAPLPMDELARITG